MNTKIYIYIPFNMTDLNVNGGWRFKKTLAKKSWWKKREEITRKYVIPAYQNQKSKNYILVPVFTTDIPHGYADEIISMYKDIGAVILWDDKKLSGHAEPYRWMREHYKMQNVECDGLWLLLLGSDDVISKNAISYINKITPYYGLAMYHQQIYVYDIEDKRLAVYDTQNSGSSIFYRFFPNTVLNSTIKDYIHEVNFELYHHQIGKRADTIPMPISMGCVLLHGGNTESRLEHPHFKKNIVAEVIDKDKKNMILERFSIYEA